MYKIHIIGLSYIKEERERVRICSIRIEHIIKKNHIYDFIEHHQTPMWNIYNVMEKLPIEIPFIVRTTHARTHPMK